MRFDIVTLFPDFFRGPFDFGVLQRAIRQGRVEIELHDLRTYTHDRHRTVDDRPFGGGEGMVLKPEPLFECVEALGIAPKLLRDGDQESVVLLSAGGSRFRQQDARDMAKLQRVVLICGRYEGVDERVPQLLCDRELSIGDYVLSGGELGAAVIVDAVTRLLPGVLGHADSTRFESFGEGDDPGEGYAMDGSPRATHGAGGLLDYPQYTRPASFRGIEIPEVLGSGDHAGIRQWRRRAALERTLAHRPDLLDVADLSADDRMLLESIRSQERVRRETGK
ncbi:MAG: tRNA (guanosine(37)-N1)-methyltransferase TrmD [Janthinobacterium lividum]